MQLSLYTRTGWTSLGVDDLKRAYCLLGEMIDAHLMHIVDGRMKGEEEY